MASNRERTEPNEGDLNAQNEVESGQGDRGDRKSTGTGMGAGEGGGERGGAPFDLGRTNEPEGEEPPPAA